MSTSTAPTRPSPADPEPQPARPRRQALRDLDHPRDAFAHLTPNWYAAVMGTGIVAVAAATLPVRLAGLDTVAVLAWASAALLLVALTAATAVHWCRHRETARRHARHPVMAHFYGAPPMALLTVGAGTLLVGKDVLGESLALRVDAVLWTAGTLAGLATAVVGPYLMLTRQAIRPGNAFGGWLMPVVPPMVSASTGALLVPHLPPGPARLSLLLACYAMFGLSLLASLVVITLIGRRLARHPAGEARMVPTVWIVLGPLGQSVTAANLLGGVAHLALPAPQAHALQVFGVVYGVPVWGFALLWAGLATAITARTARTGLPFSLTWWSFTFPVGTVVTGTGALARHTGAGLFTGAAVLFFAVLVAAWVVVATRTAEGAFHGRLFLPAPVPVPVPVLVPGPVVPGPVLRPAAR